MNLVTSTANPIWHFNLTSGGPRRVVHVPPKFSSSGHSPVETTILELARQQSADAKDPVIITTLASTEARHEVIGGIRVHRHPHSYFLFGGQNAPAATAVEEEGLLSIPVFQSLMQEPEVRLFHCHTLGRLAEEVMQAARMRFRPFVASVYQRPDAATLASSRKELEAADIVIFASKFEAEQGAAILGHDRVAHLPEGVNCKRFAAGDGVHLREELRIPASAFVVGNACDADAPRLQLLLDAFAGLAPQHERLRLLLPRPRLEQDATHLAALIQARNLSERVLLHNTGEGTERAGFLHACDAVILVSAGQVAPREVFEVWSAGKPMIGDRFSGIGTLVHDGETGLLFDPESSQAVARLSSHIEAVLKDENLRQKLAEKGQAEAQSHDWSQVQAKLEEIYQEAERHHKKARDLRLKAAA